MILLIDNYDSFTYNLVQRLGELDRGLDLRVVRNDKITPAEAAAMHPSHVIISPGPCTPREAGVSPGIIRELGGKVPILGVCLGHQCIGDLHGMTVSRHIIPMHGKTSPIQHDSQGVFAGLPSPFVATRYHSLVVLAETVPAEGWAVSAWTDEPVGDGTGEMRSTRRVVMGLRRLWAGDTTDRAPMEGVQFHPESFLTTEGPKLLKNFLEM
ncbi:MAG: aminodeoxychorismate/anthranilate synthase component II [Pyrinomonadaceae bacterium]|nr:aminodeoxychorismate/anthranilate synthase component II [Phycisphaerales bacterium]